VSGLARERPGARFDGDRGEGTGAAQAGRGAGSEGVDRGSGGAAAGWGGEVSEVWEEGPVCGAAGGDDRESGRGIQGGARVLLLRGVPERFFPSR